MTDTKITEEANSVKEMSMKSTPREKIKQLILRHDLKMCFLCYIVGVVWFALLANPELNGHTYFSENALLPGLVEHDFHHDHGASEYLRALKVEVNKQKSNDELRLKIPVEWLTAAMNEIGLDTYVQNYTFKYPANVFKDEVFKGRNVYGILRAVKTSGTEALVLSAPYRPEPFGENTLAGIAVMLSVARAFRNHLYWAKDIIFLVTEDDEIGMQAWLSSYHHTSNEYIMAGDLLGRSGAIQAALNLEIGTETISRFDVRIEGLNGQLPNLDFVNTAVRLCKREGITPTIQKRVEHTYLNSFDGFLHSLKTMLLQMSHLATGSPTGNHGLYHRYNIEAITLHGVKLRNSRVAFDFIDIGRVVEGIFRSLNNLLERFHQSFFFYLLPSVERYVSIGVYMPPLGVIALPVIIKVIALWIGINQSNNLNLSKSGDGSSCVHESSSTVFSYLLHFVTAAFFGVCAYYGPESFIRMGHEARMDVTTALTFGFLIIHLLIIVSPFYMNWLVFNGTRRVNAVGLQKVDVKMVRCIALITLGILLGTTAVVNVSLAFFVAVIAVPIAVTITPSHSRLINIFKRLVLILVSPFSAICLASFASVLLKEKTLTGLNVEKAIAESWNNAQLGLLSSVIQMDMLDNWTYGLVSFAYLSNWAMFWQVMSCDTD